MISLTFRYVGNMLYLKDVCQKIVYVEQNIAYYVVSTMKFVVHRSN